MLSFKSMAQHNKLKVEDVFMYLVYEIEHVHVTNILIWIYA